MGGHLRTLNQREEPAMPLIEARILVGFVAGFLVGLSGRRNGVPAPSRVFGWILPSRVAVGPDTLFNLLTSVPAHLLHPKKGTIRP